jgi:hypothetical protein
MAHPVVKEALHVIESELVPDFRNQSLISSLELNSRSFETRFNIPQSQKSQELMDSE